MDKLVVGQRFMSIAEPELGLGAVESIEDKQIKLRFDLAGESRLYGIKSAPLKRIIFSESDEIKDLEDRVHIVSGVEVLSSGLVQYQCSDEVLVETELSAKIAFNNPVEKILNSQADKYSLFNLRYQTFKYRSWLSSLEVRGFLGARLSLIEHQFYIANQIVKRTKPRVLLADEVGLGKTIETGLILHQMIVTNKMKRVLIITPSSLNFQWFVEMQRKYNLGFSILNEQTIENYEGNPFDESNLIITNFDFIQSFSEQAQNILQANWDCLVVDEAHKIKWSQTEASVEYSFIEEISNKTAGLILLSATPEYYGLEGHFSHLRLIDPDKFNDFEKFKTDQLKFKETAQQAKKLIKEIEAETENEDELQKLIDSHGTGRVFYRNTRENIDKEKKYFPKRNLVPIELESNVDSFKTKIDWLVGLLEKDQSKKYLLICSSKELVDKIEYALSVESVGNKVGLFHENLSLMARDRQAAYFSENGGANLLLCTEIGSEGRNFQFCQDMILFDLPASAELLEQRIGRLDRIGQKRDIFIHVPFIKDSVEEKQFQFYNKVFNSFKLPSKGTQKTQEMFQEKLNTLDSMSAQEFNKLLSEAEAEYLDHCKKIQEGRDILIELNSFNEQKSKEVIQAVREIDKGHELKDFLESCYSHFGVDVEDLDQFSQFIRPGDNMFIASFPGLTDKGLSYTFDRQTALQREELDFMTWDHPLVIGVMDLIIGEEYGNSTVVSRKNGKVKPFIECFYLARAKGSESLQLEKYFPIKLLRSLIDLEGVEFSNKWDKESLDDKLEDSQPQVIKKVTTFPKPRFNQILSQAIKSLESNLNELKQSALDNLKIIFDREIERMKYLESINPLISKDDIKALEGQYQEISQAIEQVEMTLDSVRFIY